MLSEVPQPNLVLTPIPPKGERLYHCDRMCCRRKYDGWIWSAYESRLKIFGRAYPCDNPLSSNRDKILFNSSSSRSWLCNSSNSFL